MTRDAHVSDNAPLREACTFVADCLLSGKTRTEIVAALTSAGWDASTAANFVNRVATSLNASRKTRFRMWKAARPVVVGIIALLVANVVLVGGQKLWKREDQEQLDAARKALAQSKHEIDLVETQLAGFVTDLNSTRVRIKSLEQSAKLLEATLGDNFSEAMYSRYSNAIDRHNVLVEQYVGDVSGYDALYARYTSMTELYNKDVNAANAIAKKVGPTWYLIPVPGGKAHVDVPHAPLRGH